MTLEDKEKALKQYVIEQLNLTLVIGTPTPNVLDKLAHNLIQDFKNEVDGFNDVLEEENRELKEKLEAFGEAFSKFTSEVNNYE